jgi:threonine dehydrogenase-like Zn-dependent dehydrogenase
VLECAGTEASVQTAIAATRPGGRVGRIGGPHYPAVPLAAETWVSNVTVGGGLAPVRAYLDELLPDVLSGTINPGRVFDRTVDLGGVPDGYQAMADRSALKVMIAP